MAHFAELDDSGTVIRVIVVINELMLDDNGHESEPVGAAYCQSLFGAETRWAQTSYSGKFRKNYAGIGYTFDTQRDAFIPPKPNGDHWLLDEGTCQWYNTIPTEP
jgi:hypothetical protein